MAESIECVVVGAGVVGLSVARAMAVAGLETIVLEQEDRIGTSTSSRNSEVIHAGLHYAPGSLKARLCVHGKALLYDYCRQHGIEYSQCGKLIVATSEEQLPDLQRIMAVAEANGVTDLERLGRAAALELEPELECVAALLSPSTGIIDTHGLMLSLQGDMESHGGMLAVESTVTGGTVTGDGVLLEVAGDTDMEIEARYVINCAGLSAQQVAHSLAGMPADNVPRGHLAKGNYFSYTHRAPFRHLVYPVPHQYALGVHLTLDLGGRARFGPDMEWVDEIDYDVDPARASAFYEAIRQYWPGLPDDSLAPDYSGIRPKLQGAGDEPRDFCIQGAETHGVSGLVNLFGIESPGLTATLAIADLVRDRLLSRGDTN
ncbi:MAG: NAD(P)/FAD-dependent oxidoreductase [Woeseiaceae bacterium]|nr:NAD(P)/FAD-dependent oxidoreductase [Woeseiaceae bacterium]